MATTEELVKQILERKAELLRELEQIESVLPTKAKKRDGRRRGPSTPHPESMLGRILVLLSDGQTWRQMDIKKALGAGSSMGVDLMRGEERGLLEHPSWGFWRLAKKDGAK